MWQRSDPPNKQVLFLPHQSPDHRAVLNESSTDVQLSGHTRACQLLRPVVKLQIQMEVLKGRLSFHLPEDVFLALIARQGERKSRTPALFGRPQNMGSSRDLVKAGLGHSLKELFWWVSIIRGTTGFTQLKAEEQ